MKATYNYFFFLKDGIILVWWEKMYIIKNKKQQHENQEKKGFEHGNIYWNRIDVIWIKQPLFALATNSGVGMCVCVCGVGGSGYYPLLIILEMIFVELL